MPYPGLQSFASLGSSTLSCDVPRLPRLQLSYTCCNIHPELAALIFQLCLPGNPAGIGRRCLLPQITYKVRGSAAQAGERAASEGMG